MLPRSESAEQGSDQSAAERAISSDESEDDLCEEGFDSELESCDGDFQGEDEDEDEVENEEGEEKEVNEPNRSPPTKGESLSPEGMLGK